MAASVATLNKTNINMQRSENTLLNRGSLLTAKQSSGASARAKPGQQEQNQLWQILEGHHTALKKQFRDTKLR